MKSYTFIKKQSSNDQQCTFEVAIEGYEDKIRIEFEIPIKQFCLDKSTAIQFAESIIEATMKIK